VRATLRPDELGSPHPILGLMPGLYQDDDLTGRFTEALDTVIAPVISVLDSRDAYVDPMLAPIDFVTWLAQWVGAELDASWPEHRQRALVARAAELYAWRGTIRGLSELIVITTGIVPEIEETGGVIWTSRPPPAGELPGYRTAALVVRVRVPSGATPVDPARLDRMVAAAKPAHVPHRVEVVQAPAQSPARKAAPQRARPSAGSSSRSGSSTPRAQPSSPAAGTPIDDLDEPWTGGDGGDGKGDGADGGRPPGA